jgi:hypothetical protein
MDPGTGRFSVFGSNWLFWCLLWPWFELLFMVEPLTTDPLDPRCLMGCCCCICCWEGGDERRSISSMAAAMASMLRSRSWSTMSMLCCSL